MAKTMNEHMNELGIKICPICGKEYVGYPAISRRDNKTEICSQCGTMESLEDYLNARLENKENDNRYCIFEKRICRFARKDENTFSCEARSDEALKLICKAQRR